MGFPPEMFTKEHATPPDSLYEELAEEFPQHVRRNSDGEWEIDVFDGNSGTFTRAIKEFHARSMTKTIKIGQRVRNQDGEIVLEEEVEVRIETDGTATIGLGSEISKLPAGLYTIERDEIPLERS